MAYFVATPPSIEQLLGDVVEWIARNLCAKVTVTVLYRDGRSFTEILDVRGLEQGDQS